MVKTTVHRHYVIVVLDVPNNTNFFYYFAEILYRFLSWLLLWSNIVLLNIFHYYLLSVAVFTQVTNATYSVY